MTALCISMLSCLQKLSMGWYIIRETFIIQTRTSGSSQNVVFGQPFRV